jgi:CubicO group peptidase (beta-lactamase class C family)
VPARPIAMAHAFTAGGLCATAPALVAWSRALAGGTIVDAASWRAMTTPVALADGSQFGYGLGLFVAELGGHRAIFHGGGVNGFVSTLAYYPDDDVYIAILVNTDGNVADELGESVARTLLKLPKSTAQDLAVSPEEARAVAGRYEAIGVDATLIIELANGKLVGHREGGEPKALQRQPDGSYTIPDRQARLTFHREDNRVTGFTYVQAGMTFEARRVTAGE